MADNYVIVHTDGACYQASPTGKAVWAAIVQPPRGEGELRMSRRIDADIDGTSGNMAELIGVINGLKAVRHYLTNYQHVALYTDSQWVERTFNGVYKGSAHAGLFAELRKVAETFQHCYIGWVPRQLNGDADKLAGAAMRGTYAWSIPKALENGSGGRRRPVPYS